MGGSPFVAYIDETGDHGLENINPTAPIFALCAALYRIEDYLNHDQPALTGIKFRLWAHDNVVFHSYTIRRRLPPFQALIDPANRERLMNEIARFFQSSKAVLIAAAIDKPRHNKQYTQPENPYFLAVQFVLERIYGEVRLKGGSSRETVCIFESRGAAEDQQVRQWFNAVCGGMNQWNCKLPFRAQFASKQTNMAGLQVADLAAYPIAKQIEDPTKKRRDFLALEPRLRRSPNGTIHGWGLKVFPPLPSES